MPRPSRPIPLGSQIGIIFPVRSGRTWRAVAEVTPPGGDRFQVSKSAASYDEARAKLERAIATVAATQRRWTVAELADAWAAFQQGPNASVTDSTRLQYLDMWERKIKTFTPEFSRVPLGEREPASVTRQELFECVHAAGSSARYVVNALRALWKFAANRGVVTENVTLGGFQLKGRKPQPKPLDLQTIDRIETHLASLERRGRRTDTMLLLDVWVLLRASGARIGEALALKVGDIDFDAAQVHLAEQHVAKVSSPNGRVTDGITPGGKTPASTRTVVVPRRALDGLKIRCVDMTGDPADWTMRDRGDFVFRTDRGKFVSPSSFRSRLGRELTKLDLDRTVTPHDLRDTVATAIVKALTEKHGLSAGLTEAARVLGHNGIGPALLAYVEKAATVVDHVAILEGLDPQVRRERARQRGLEDIAQSFFGAAVTRLSADSFELSVLKEHLLAAESAVSELDFTVLVTELDPDHISY
ncbi:site-specific integrase [Microbacterium sp. zg-YB36]|uniref:tyrosine-type recombinase/integrase n=1 Tax=Microbacterium sp. zg-YB36 TaxID=2969407 RepID=UPI00214D05A1|nr:site-specific integrase [Microbacterium sp. zg-YB36]MDL5352163.1 site-specific integrase [Microbacterium sp. zg-YB36]